MAGLLAHELGGVGSLPALLRRSLQLLVAALPLALVLFLFVPRIAPLWTTDLGPRGGAVTGLSAQMDPLSISELVRSDAPAARVTLEEAEQLRPDAYWRVLVHEQFDGRRWRHQDPPLRRRPPQLPLLSAAPAQWWRVEPSPVRAVPWDGSAQPTASNQWVSPEGELLLDTIPPSPQLPVAEGSFARHGSNAGPCPRSGGRHRASCRDCRPSAAVGENSRWTVIDWRLRKPGSAANCSPQPAAGGRRSRCLPVRSSGGVLRPLRRSAGGLDAWRCALTGCGGYQGGRVVMPLSGGPYLTYARATPMPGSRSG